jgi:predicted amidohydrolase
MELRVAGAQIAVSKSIDANVEAITRAIGFARQERADLLLTPEGSLSGYGWPFDPAPVDGPLRHVTGVARDAGVGLALGTLYREVSDGRFYNQIRFYASDGEFLGFHGKTLTCGDPANPRSECGFFAVSPLRVFQFKGITVAGLICNDMWATPGWTWMPDPHLTKQLAAMGAQIVFHAVNGGRDGGPGSAVVWSYHESNLLLRSKADKLWIVTVDNCDPPHLRCSAPSGVIEHGSWVLQARPQGEHLFVHTIRLP